MKNIYLLAACTLVAAVGFTGCATSALVSATVDFGVTPADGGACTGRGLCSVKANPTSTTTSTTTSSSTATTFQLSPNDKNILNISFSLTELKQKQPNEAQFFNPGMPNFNFDKEFDFTDPMFNVLHLQPNARIMPSTTNTMVIDGDKVTISYKYDHN